MSNGKGVCILSGGLDSTTLLHLMVKGYKDEYDKFDEVVAISFDYGQKHKTELTYAMGSCSKLGITHDVVDLSPIGNLLKSALTDHTQEVPEGHYAADNMKATVVPNRNMIMASIAAGYAISIGADAIATAVHAGDHAIYPDCRLEFWGELAQALNTGNEGFTKPDFGVYVPFINSSKTDIARMSSELGVLSSDTWSCYKGGTFHCGKCGTCVERIEAFEEAGVKDHTIYEATENVVLGDA